MDQSKIKILVVYLLESMGMVITVTMGLMAALSLLVRSKIALYYSMETVKRIKKCIHLILPREAPLSFPSIALVEHMQLLN